MHFTTEGHGALTHKTLVLYISLHWAQGLVAIAVIHM